MKQIITLFLILSSFFMNAQTNVQEMDSTLFLFNIVLVIGLFYLLFTFIAWIESKGKEKDLSSKSTGTFETLIISVLINLFIFGYCVSDEIPNKIIIVFAIIVILKIIYGVIVSNTADKQNRNTVLWFILGFIEYHAALLVLMSSKRILKTVKSADENIQKANEEYKAKIKTLSDLNNSGILNVEELST